MSNTKCINTIEGYHFTDIDPGTTAGSMQSARCKRQKLYVIEAARALEHRKKLIDNGNKNHILKRDWF